MTFLLFSFFVFRIKYRWDYKNNQRLSPLSSVLGILLFGVHGNSIYLILPTKWPYLPQIKEYPGIEMVFVGILGIGIIILLISWFKLGTKVSMGVDKNRIQTGGIYKYSRNPQLVGYGLILASFLIAYFSYMVLIWFLIYLIAAFFMVKTEEEFLEQKYNEEYKEYCRQVPRIIKI